MQALTKKHHTKKQTTKDKIIHVQVGRRAYAIPKNVAEQYRVDPNENKYKEEFISVEELFKDLNEQYTKAGALLKGLRARENLSQIEFAKLIHVTQANLSKMENGKRPIGKTIAKRLEQTFNVNYKYFLE
ncbi:TPA: helix-turn-helix domain-containing protein [Legionella pneumophila]|uniref:helix-turn-helix domain-containing protein n=1 Tax=Legionella pneumophila TaxID=446 RepID=UPI0007873E41|nr:helix-turn-helix transcriptional regulator [Legionella pneumophila]HAT3892527.1 helix-turn-helix transcriptional regulator [Legionella pneumophila]HAT8124188.1 helix-turn-helix domain-containing protein [Legionella pneumophila]HAU1192497.1 helix-turn-helix transcriptional regulator [Legionella pneumophila]HBD7103074.1 helix-turn-helix transcriptional regulator [Legionella pneumophila]HCO4739586.1 helix-turn-helix transcriptional regulator [Legionella pneumophila]